MVPGILGHRGRTLLPAPVRTARVDRPGRGLRDDGRFGHLPANRIRCRDRARASACRGWFLARPGSNATGRRARDRETHGAGHRHRAHRPHRDDDPGAPAAYRHDVRLAAVPGPDTGAAACPVHAAGGRAGAGSGGDDAGGPDAAARPGGARRFRFWPAAVFPSHRGGRFHRWRRPPVRRGGWCARDMGRTDTAHGDAAHPRVARSARGRGCGRADDGRARGHP